MKVQLAQQTEAKEKAEAAIEELNVDAEKKQQAVATLNQRVEELKYEVTQVTKEVTDVTQRHQEALREALAERDKSEAEV